jgi:hypothetical protein
MAVSKLAIADKEEMVRLYRETSASFSQLAKRYGISVSTVSRFLQEAIPEAEYRQLVGYKQSRRPKRGELSEIEPLSSMLKRKPSKLELISHQPPTSPVQPPTQEKQLAAEVPDDLVKEIAEELAVIDDEFAAVEEEDSLEEETEDSVEDFVTATDLLGLSNPLAEVKVHPFSEAVLPELCYMIVDKAHEIVARPLQAFKDLGKIPEAELQSLTVPIFDNHRVVRRYCHPHQLIIKFPSGLLSATKNKLLQKGITRLLIGGQVYALS